MWKCGVSSVSQWTFGRGPAGGCSGDGVRGAPPAMVPASCARARAAGAATATAKARARRARAPDVIGESSRRASPPASGQVTVGAQVAQRRAVVAALHVEARGVVVGVGVLRVERDGALVGGDGFGDVLLVRERDAEVEG